MKRTIYFTVFHDDMEEFDVEINLKLQEGFKLYGSPYAGQHAYVYQALIYEAEIED